MQNFELEKIINQYLQIHKYRDYAPNGLQVQGKSEIKKIVTGVTACQLLLDEAARLQADAILVHHGYFWKNEPQTITGIKYQRIKTLIDKQMNLFAYHLPLDGHPIIGNNAQLADLFSIIPDQRTDISQLLFTGTLIEPMTALNFNDLITEKLDRKPLFCGENTSPIIKRIAWCSGAGQDFIEDAINLGVDAFLTGEVSERTIHIAREYGINFYAAGHHATERAGIKKLGEWITTHHPIETIFIDIDNPV